MSNTAAPTILKSPDLPQAPSQVSKDPKGFFRRNIFFIIVVILVLAVAAELYFGVTSLFSPNRTNNLSILAPRVNEMSDARFSLLPDKPVYKTGDNVVVDVKLYTGGHTITSGDLVVKYDASFLRPAGQNAVQVGQIFPDYPPVQVDEGQQLIGVSGVNFESSQTFSGTGLFAKLNFIALKEGQTEVVIDFAPGETGDSNVILASDLKDVLGLVDNATINISATGQGQADDMPQSCGSFTQSCQSASGLTGTQVCNAGTMRDGVCSYDPKVTSSCEECIVN